MAFRQGRVAVFIPIRLEIQFGIRQRPDFLALIEDERLDQAHFHGLFQVKIHDDMGEVGQGNVFPCSNLVVRRGGKIHLNEAMLFGVSDQVQAFLPFYLVDFAFLFEVVDMVRFIIEHHQTRQVFQVIKDIAALKLPV